MKNVLLIKLIGDKIKLYEERNANCENKTVKKE